MESRALLSKQANIISECYDSARSLVDDGERDYKGKATCNCRKRSIPVKAFRYHNVNQTLYDTWWMGK